MQTKLSNDALQSLTIAQLKPMAKRLGVPKYYNLRKQELIQEILAASNSEEKGLSSTSNGSRFHKIFAFVKKRWGLISGLAVILTIIVHSLNIFSVISPKSSSTKLANTPPVTFVNDSTTELKILLLPFHPDKNCLIEDVKYEEQLLERFQSLVHEENIPMNIKLERNQICPKSEKEALDYAKAINADLIIWGRYEEECEGNDKVCLQYSFTDDSQLHKGILRYGSSGLQILESASQLRSGFLQEDIDYIIFWTIAINNYQRNDFKSAIKWLSRIVPAYPCDNEIGHLLGLSHLMDRNVQQSKEVFQKQIECHPTNPSNYYFLAEASARVMSSAFDSDSIVLHNLEMAAEVDPTYFPAVIERAYYELGSIGQKTFRGAVSMEFSEDPNDMRDMRLMYLNEVFSFKISTLDSTKHHELLDFSEETYYRIADLISSTDSIDVEDREKYYYYLGLLFSFKGDIHQLARENQEAIQAYTSSIMINNVVARNPPIPKYFYLKQSLQGKVLLKRALMYSQEGKLDSMNMDINSTTNISQYTNVDYSETANRIRNQQRFLQETIQMMSMRPDTMFQLR